MSYLIYEKARKLGEKAYREAVSHGKSPYLPVLDEMIGREDIRGEVNLGLVNIPLERVVGTATSGRTTAFAQNFMPILDMKTEFGVKWTKLCEAQMTEGIRDPIKVYEYLNYYYVVEGNKRVSVLKYFGADSIPAMVTRKVPRLTDDPEIRKYYAFMDFYRETGVNYIWFSREEGFRNLIQAVGSGKTDEASAENANDRESAAEKPQVSGIDGGADAEKKGIEADTVKRTYGQSMEDAVTGMRDGTERIWSEDTCLTVKSVYYRFQKVFREKGGGRFTGVTTGDAFLAAVRMESLDKLEEMSDDEMKTMVTGMWEEFQLLNNHAEPVEVALDPPEEKKNIFSMIFPTYSASKPLTAVFLYDLDPSVSDWTFGHELGRNHVKETFGDIIRTLRVVTDDTGETAQEIMEDLIEKEGADVIFTTTANFISASLKCAVKHPEVRILNCSLNTSHRYIRTYAARLFEAKFLSGVIAGALSKEGKLGYLADHPIFGVTAEINAFALGAKMVRPDATVKLCWTTLKEGSLRSEIQRELIAEGVDFVSDQDMIAPIRSSRKFGLYRLGDEEPVNFAMPLYNWGVFYEHILRMILSGAWNSADASDASKAINYWWGLSAGVIDIILSEKIPPETRRLVDLMRQQIIDDRLKTFEGPIRDNTGKLICPEGKYLIADDIIRIDWLAENVIGSIPPLSALKETARHLVEMKGVMHEDKDIDPGKDIDKETTKEKDNKNEDTGDC